MNHKSGTRSYEIDDLSKEESWRMFRIMGEFVEGFDKLSGIGPAISIYGSARTNTDDKLYGQTEEIARRLGELGFSIITGGGPGVMEAANKGAAAAGVASIGLNIDLPTSQACNIYATKPLNFKYFFVRKVMLVKYASAFLIMPGGMGTLDELSEVLNLMQTGKIKPFPVILYNSEFWGGFLNWLCKDVLGRNLVSEKDFDLLRICDTPDEVIDIVGKWSANHEITGKKAVCKSPHPASL